MGPIVSQSATPDDNLTGPGLCGTGPSATCQGRCGYGPRLPLLVISPSAKTNFVDHSVADRSSILRFTEDNWNLRRIGDHSLDAVAGSLLNMFTFQGSPAPALIHPRSRSRAEAGRRAAAMFRQRPPGRLPVRRATTTASQMLDGLASVSFDGKPLTYSWSVDPAYP